METLIKWPGGKKAEADNFIKYIPEFDRYVEPFFGGGAIFFELQPERACINDFSTDLMLFYRLIRDEDFEFKQALKDYASTFELLQISAHQNYAKLKALFDDYDMLDNSQVKARVRCAVRKVLCVGGIKTSKTIFDEKEFVKVIETSVVDKIRRTRKNNATCPFSAEDLEENLVTGFTSGYYLYQRNVFNDILMGRLILSDSFRAANFYFVREYCYGSMFRYNAQGEFNIPYGGTSYNKKNFRTKIERLFSPDTVRLFANTKIGDRDFEDFLRGLDLTDKDFVFLDPPYDTEFSDYEGKAFGKDDQTRLRDMLKNLPAKFMLVIKNTDFIHKLYETGFYVSSFDKNYTYNVKGRNDRAAEHLIITNYPLLAN